MSTTRWFLQMQRWSKTTTEIKTSFAIDFTTKTRPSEWSSDSLRIWPIFGWSFRKRKKKNKRKQKQLEKRWKQKKRLKMTSTWITWCSDWRKKEKSFRRRGRSAERSRQQNWSTLERFRIMLFKQIILVFILLLFLVRYSLFVFCFIFYLQIIKE